jgi:DNA replication protein
MPTTKMFAGFGDSEAFTSVPDTLFAELLPQVRDLRELKVVLYALWRIQHMDSPLKALSRKDFAEIELGMDADHVGVGIEMAVADGVLLQAVGPAGIWYLLNSSEGRAAARAIIQGKWRGDTAVSSTPLERPNLFGLYEQNIGPLTPVIADALKDAEQSFPHEWISEAIELAVRNNKRSWSYCEAILRRWKEEGRGAKQNRRDNQAARQRDVEEKIRKFIRG